MKNEQRIYSFFFFLSFTQILLNASSQGLCVYQTNLFCFPPEIHTSHAQLKVSVSMELSSCQWNISKSDVYHLRPGPLCYMCNPHAHTPPLPISQRHMTQ